MKILKKILYKPYLLLVLIILLKLYNFSISHQTGALVTEIFAYSVFILFMRFLFSFLKNPLLKLLSYIEVFNTVPNAVLSGYLFILTLFAPIPVVIIAIISKLFIHPKEHDHTFTDEYGNQVTRIRSLTPTVLLRRKESKDEYIAVTKLNKKPKKITYE
ncbi:MAG TPA: hypothetical protein VM077_01920 [Candidatus Limnocylindrales bacterium]|nr:hypothetical protein [Candidatus Limnocylindrales bacterium]